MNIAETIYNDASTMERLVKIVEALWSGTAQIINNSNDNCIACQIGEYWFYFINNEDENLTLKELRKSYSVFEIAQMILDAIIDLEDEEYTYYTDYLGF